MTTHQHFALRRPLARLSRRAALAVALAFAFAGTASAATETWKGTTSAAWSDATNWNTAVPGLGDDANIDTTAPNAPVFNDGSTTNKLGAVTLGIAGSGSLGINASSHLVATQFSIGDGANATGSTTISGKGALSVANDVYVGNKGTGTLTVQKSAGGIGTLMDTNGWIGKAVGGTGTATVDGQGSVWINFFNLGVGDSGLGTLNITNGGAVSDSSATIGGHPVPESGSVVTVSDPGSNWNTDGALIIGDAGTGALKVLNGATAASADSVVGNQLGGEGEVYVDQANSKWTVQGLMTIGEAGNGSVVVTNGGTVSAIRAIFGNAGGSLSGGALFVDSGGNVTVSNDVTVGGHSFGEVALSGGGNLKASGALNIGTGTGEGALVIGKGLMEGSPGTPILPGTLTLPGATVTLGANGEIIFNHNASTPYVFPHILAVPAGGTGGTINVYAGPTSFTADSSAFSGKTNVYGGTLFVNGKLGTGAVTVSGGTLGGSGSIAGPVTVQSGGAIAPGNSPGTLTTGGLTLNSGSQLDYDLGAPGTIGGGVNDLLVVNGNLALGGTLNIANASGFAAGTYRLINYSGTLSGAAPSIGNLPAGFTASQMKVDTSTPGQVNLVVTTAAPGAPTLTVLPPILTWSNVSVGSSGGAKTVTLTNTGMATLTLVSISAPAAPFTVFATNCVTFTLPAGSSCTIQYDFTPTVADAFLGSIVIKSDSSTGPVSISLSATSVAAGTPALTISPTNLDWGNVAPGSSGGVKTVTLTNTGTATLHIDSISAASAPFGQSGGETCVAAPFTLATGASCTLAYDFDPTKTGSFSATVNVVSDAPPANPNSPGASFTLNGTAAASPSALTVAAPALSPAMLFVLVLMLGGGGAWICRRRGT